MTSSGIVFSITCVLQILVQNILLFAKFKTKPIIQPKLLNSALPTPRYMQNKQNWEKKEKKSTHTANAHRSL